MDAGHLIVLEGMDGAGTTTQARLLGERLRRAHVPVHVTAQPSSGPIGALLRQALAGRLVMGGGGAPAWSTMALLFAADRLDHLDNEILPNLRDGVSVVCDRYYHSSFVYQSATGGGAAALAWLQEINLHARRPDLTLVLDVPPQLAARRRGQRQGAREIYDDETLQARLGQLYAELERHFPGERIVHIDSSAAVEAVEQRVFAEVSALRARP